MRTEAIVHWKILRFCYDFFRFLLTNEVIGISDEDWGHCTDKQWSLYCYQSLWTPLVLNLVLPGTFWKVSNIPANLQGKLSLWPAKVKFCLPVFFLIATPSIKTLSRLCWCIHFSPSSEALLYGLLLYNMDVKMTTAKNVHSLHITFLWMTWVVCVLLIALSHLFRSALGLEGSHPGLLLSQGPDASPSASGGAGGRPRS